MDTPSTTAVYHRTMMHTYGWVHLGGGGRVCFIVLPWLDSTDMYLPSRRPRNGRSSARARDQRAAIARI